MEIEHKVSVRPILYATAILIVTPTYAFASPAPADVRAAEVQVLSADSVVGALESLAYELSDIEIGIVESFLEPPQYRAFKRKVGSHLSKASMVVGELNRSFKAIRRSMTSMGDFQIYQGILLELSLSSASVSSASQRLRFAIGQMDNERVTRSARILTYLGLGLAILGFAIGVRGFKSIHQNINLHGGDRTRNGRPRKRLHPFAIILMAGSLLVGLFAVLFGPLNQNMPRLWSFLIVVASGFTLAFLAQYVADTRRLAQTQVQQLAYSQKPIIGFEFIAERNPERHDVHDHSLTLIATESPVHASVLVNINAKVNGRLIKWNSLYDGDKPWIVMCHGFRRGHFNVESILSKSGLKLGTAIDMIKNHRRDNGPLCETTLSIAIELWAKRWDYPDSEYEGFPSYEYEYDFERESFRLRD